MDDRQHAILMAMAEFAEQGEIPHGLHEMADDGDSESFACRLAHDHAKARLRGEGEPQRFSADFESKHPRNEDGEFSGKGGSGNASADERGKKLRELDQQIADLNEKLVPLESRYGVFHKKVNPVRQQLADLMASKRELEEGDKSGEESEDWTPANLNKLDGQTVFAQDGALLKVATDGEHWFIGRKWGMDAWSAAEYLNSIGAKAAPALFDDDGNEVETPKSDKDAPIEKRKTGEKPEWGKPAKQSGLFGEPEPTAKKPTELFAAAFRESDHPRDSDGQFTEKGGGGGATEAAKPTDTPLADGTQAKEKEVKKLIKQIVGTQKLSQPRAKNVEEGGEIGPNGEFYPAGAFIATQNLPKRIKDKIAKGAVGKVQVEDYKWEVPEPGKMSIVDKLGGTALNPRNGEVNHQYLNWQKQPLEYVKMIEEIAEKWKNGERWISVNEYPELASFKDVARLVVHGQAVPGALLDKMPEEWQKHFKKYSEEKSKGDEPKFAALSTNELHAHLTALDHRANQGDETAKQAAAEIRDELARRN